MLTKKKTKKKKKMKKKINKQPKYVMIEFYLIRFKK